MSKEQPLVDESLYFSADLDLPQHLLSITGEEGLDLDDDKGSNSNVLDLDLDIDFGLGQEFEKILAEEDIDVSSYSPSRPSPSWGVGTNWDSRLEIANDHDAVGINEKAYLESDPAVEPSMKEKNQTKNSPEHSALHQQSKRAMDRVFSFDEEEREKEEAEAEAEGEGEVVREEKQVVLEQSRGEEEEEEEAEVEAEGSSRGQTAPMPKDIGLHLAPLLSLLAVN